MTDTRRVPAPSGRLARVEARRRRRDGISRPGDRGPIGAADADGPDASAPHTRPAARHRNTPRTPQETRPPTCSAHETENEVL
ncbi:hypothetical protein GCM10010405_04690 [Streptomyces macrosporus]|uniref:Uncharacterized protein n=1 Tax=Streptomyces macrosporus TaxID=44032 RepID=A0ABP5WG45_9ACTN